MNRLMRQVYDRNQTRGRTNRVRVKPREGVIAYKAANNLPFFIHTRPVDEGGDPIVFCYVPETRGTSHKTHSLGDGRVCLADSLRGWDLTRILFQCDSWARGLEIYRATGHFPGSPREAFSGQRHLANRSIWERVFGNTY